MPLSPAREALTGALLVLVSITQAGCWMRGAAGPAIALNRGDPLATMQAEYGLGDRDEGPLVLGAVRAKVGEDLAEVGAALGGAHCFEPESVVSLCLLGGANVVQMGSVDRHYSFGMFGPFVEVPVAFQFGAGKAITLAPGIDYSLRFTGRSEGFAYVTLGFALSTLFQHDKIQNPLR
jgi:hypothetical protein